MKYNSKNGLASFVLGAFLLLSICIKAQVPIITTVAGGGTHVTGDGGPADSAQINVSSLAVDAFGNVYFADQTIGLIQKINASTCIITTVAGNGNVGYSGDGGPAISATFNSPTGVAVDDSGNLYISDYANNRIRKVTALTGIITTVAGDGGYGGYSGDGGQADSAQLYNPEGVAVDKSYNIYIADWSNARVRKVTASTGIITTIAGNGIPVFSGDGRPGDSAAIGYPFAVAVDDSANVYITDYVYSRIRKVSAATGIITTVTGSGTMGYSGDGGPADLAELSSTGGVAVDASGNIYIGDTGNHRVRKINASTDIITTFAGNGTDEDTGNGGPADSAGLGNPAGIAIDAAGNIYIADEKLIRKVTINPAAINEIAANNSILIYPNPASDAIYVSVNNHFNAGKIILTDITEKTVSTNLYNGQNTQIINISNLATGIYFISLQNENEYVTRKFVKE